MMDYYAIGQRIRKIRKAHKLSQETLSERIGISVTHMSHIGNRQYKAEPAGACRFGRSFGGACG